MTIETMDLIYSQTARFYEAPFQMKSNGGTLVIDDFGRQRVESHDLLNRWIVPFEGQHRLPDPSYGSKNSKCPSSSCWSSPPTSTPAI